ncbi:neuropeptide Y receptor type 5-like [Limulus polyphemus]|uniref:Neuropeptide Y receptor type 5-like n=1 Tax=Limulus polyphemus TaxID=6850 RepID=A0ABM1C256_LIMPO|nr:neuropeptide Y receptor type 5-like [Limulus polyphemus]
MDQTRLKLSFNVSTNFTDTDYFNELFWKLNNTENISAASWEDTLEELNKKLYRIDDVSVLVLVSLYGVVFLTGLAGNSIIAYFVSKTKHPHGRRRYNMLINLCVSDLMVILICCPMTMYTSITTVWHLGESLCKILSYLQGVSVTAGTLSMTALSLDRYISVRHPQAFLKISRHRFARILIAMVWTIALLFSLPIIFVKKTETLEIPSLQVSFCIEEWKPGLKHVFTIATLIIVYALPCVILLICQASVSRTIKYAEDSFLNRNDIRQRTFRMSSHHPNAPPPTRENRESYVGRYIGELYTWEVESKPQNIRIIERMSTNGSSSLQSRDRKDVIRSHSPRIKRRLSYLLMGMTLCFVICWLPYNIISSYVDLFEIMTVTKYLPFTLLLGHAHSAINPVIYWLLNKTLRRKMQNIKHRSTTRPSSRLQQIPMECITRNPQIQFSH